MTARLCDCECCIVKARALTDPICLGAVCLGPPHATLLSPDRQARADDQRHVESRFDSSDCAAGGSGLHSISMPHLTLAHQVSQRLLSQSLCDLGKVR